MALGILTSFWAVSFLLVISPGMDWAYAISAGIRGRMVVPAVAGILLGYLTVTAVIAVGVGAFVAQNPPVLTAITLLGSAYLLWIGIQMLVKPSTPSAGRAQQSESWAQWTLHGVGVSGLNPKGLILFLALLPQFTDPASSWSIPVQIITLGLVHIASCAVIYMLVGYCSKAVLQTRPQAARLVNRLSGAAMTVIACLLFAEQIVGRS